MDITFREYQETDRAGVIHCVGTLQDYVAKLDPLHRIRTLKDFDVDTYITQSFEKIQKEGGAVFVAEEEGQIIGCVIGMIDRVGPDNIERYPSVNGRINELVVLPEYRGQSVGNELMTLIEQYFSSKNCDVITLDCFAPNEDAYKFYKKLDYTDRVYLMMKPLKKSQNK